MRILTVKQPWASLILTTKKNCENRYWKPKQDVGLLLIHAAKVSAKIFDPKEKELLKGIDIESLDTNNSNIIGCVVMNGVTKNSYSKWCIPNQWHWKIKYPILFDDNHIIRNVKGKMRIWNYDVTKEFAEYLCQEYKERYNISLTSTDFPEIKF